MRVPVIIASCVAGLTLYACAATPNYGPASSDGGTGYSEVALEENRYRVTFRGGDAPLAQDYALRRAAELTLQRGYEWFQVTNGFTQDESSRNSGTRVSVGGSTGSYRSGVGIGVGFPIGGSQAQVVQTYEIIMGKGDKPQDPSVYDARALVTSIPTTRG